MDQISEFFSSIKGKRIAVLGIGVSNTPIIKLLHEKGADITACDKKNKNDFPDIVRDLEYNGIKLCLGEDYLKNLDYDIIIKTPGMRFDLPELEYARSKGCLVTSEMEIFFELCPCKTIAVTGSDGKTTTTTIIYEMLKNAGYKCHLGGNIGKPLLPEIEKIKKDDFAILELSSFQLHTMKKSPDIAVIINITPNHLDMHKSMQEYVQAKENIMRYQDSNGIIVLNYDNDITRSFYSKAKGKAIWFSRIKELDNAVFLRDKMIIGRFDGQERKILDIGDIMIPGMHNVENYMAAIAALYGLVTPDVIKKVAKGFAGVAHRIEFVRELDGVKYYNDSIASSPTRTIAGLNSFDQKVILIAGGYDKHIPFDDMGPAVCKKVKILILVGATAKKIENAVISAKNYKKENPQIVFASSIEDAVIIARKEAKPGDIVTMSPACASFDMFKNFEERGNHFKQIVNSL